MPEAKQSAVKVVKLVGHVRMGEPVDRMRTEIDNGLESDRGRLVIDMSSVKSLDSSAIGVLVRSLSLAKQLGGTIKLAQIPVSVSQALQVTGILKLFEVFEDAGKAVSSFM